MLIVVKEPKKDAEVREIESNLTAKQQIVGGLIDYVPFINGMDLIFNEEFLYDEDLEQNIMLNGQIYMGTVFITKANENGDFVSLQDGEIRVAQMILNRAAF